MGLGGPARPTRALGVGRDGAPAGRGVGAFRAVARLVVGVDGLPAPDRRPGPGHPRAGRVHDGVAFRPDGHRGQSRVRAGAGLVFRGREALRRGGAAVRRDAATASVWSRKPTCCRATTTRGDVRLRATADGTATVATVAASEPLRPAPADPFPATLSVPRTVSAQALVSFRGNRYSVAPELAKATVTVSHRLGTGHLDIATGAGTVIARHTLAPDGAGVMVRDHGHVLALEQAAMAAASSGTPHRRKLRIPPGTAARAAADALRTTPTCGAGALAEAEAAGVAAGDVVIDLARYAAAAHGRNTLKK